MKIIYLQVINSQKSQFFVKILLVGIKHFLCSNLVHFFGQHKSRINIILSIYKIILYINVNIIYYENNYTIDIEPKMAGLIAPVTEQILPCMPPIVLQVR